MPSDIADVGCPLGSIAGTARRGNVLSAVRGAVGSAGGFVVWAAKIPIVEVYTRGVHCAVGSVEGCVA